MKNQTVQMYYVWYCQDPDSDCQTILTSQKICLEKKQFEKGELIQYLAALCGRYNYSLPDLSILTCAYEHLIKELAKCLECFNRDQLLHIIQSIATDISLPLQMFSGYVKESETETGSMRISNSHPLDRRKPMDRQKISVKNTLCRHNQMALLKFLVPKVCEALWVDEEVVNAFEQWRTEKTLKSIPIKNSWATTVKTTLHVLSMDWYALELSDELAKKLVLYSLFYIEQILNKDEQASILHYFILINHKALSVLGSRTLEWDHCQPLAYLYIGLIEKYPSVSEGTSFNYIMELLSGALPWFPLKERERMADYSLLLWSCIIYCMETIAQGPRVCDDDSTPETSIPLASPESGEGSPTVSFNDESEWLETMFYQSSTDSDGKEDERMTEEHDKLKERLLDLLSSAAPHILLSDELVEVFFEMLQSSNFYGIPRDMVGKVISPILLNASLELKKTLVDNCMSETANDPLNMMKFFFLYAEEPAVYADLAVRKCVKNLLKVGGDEVLSPQRQNDVLMLRLCRFLIPRAKALTYITKLVELLKDEANANTVPHFFERLFHFLYIFIYTSSTMDFLPANLQMEDFTIDDLGCTEDDLNRLIRSFADLSSKYPAPVLPVFKFPFLTKQILEETEDTLILSHMYRLIPFASSELGTSFYQTMYRKSPELIKAKEEYFSPELYSDKLGAAVLAYSVHQMKEEKYFYNFYDCILISVSYQIKMTAEVIKALALFIERADIFSIGHESEAKHQTTIDKLCNVFLIYRNPVLAECTRFLSQAHEGVAHNLSLKIPKNEKARKAITHYSNDRFHIRKRDYVLLATQSRDIVTCFMQTRAEIVYFLFDVKMTFEPLGDEHIEMINLLVQACSSALTTTSDFELITTYLNNVDIAPMAHTRFILTNLMNGVSDCSPIVEKDLEVKPLTLAYATTISEFFVDEKFGAHKWGPDALRIVNDFFDKFSDTPKTGRAFLPAFATALKKIFSNKHCKVELCTVLRNIISSKINLFSKWVEYSVCPSAFVCEILPIINDLVDRNLISKEELSVLVENSVEFVLKPDLIEQLHSMFPLILQESDRFLHSRLKFVSEPQPLKSSSSAPFASYPLKEGQLMFHDALQLLCKYGNTNAHLKILKLACSNLHRWCGIPQEYCDALEGLKMFKTEEFSVVFRMMVSSALFSYLTELSAYVQDRSVNTDVDYSSDSESVKKMLTKKTHLQTNISTMESSTSGHPMSYCTYLSSEQQFIQQHWYNCYTCKMIESVGVCSVCAASCHLGHEVVYSKHGPFFCDCGARGCTSLQQGAVNCSPLNACRGRILSTETPADAEVKDVKMFAIPENLGIDNENVRSEINTLLENFNKNWGEVENLFESVVQAKQYQWNMDDRRNKAKEQMLVGELSIDYKQEFMEQTFLGQKHHLNFASTKRETQTNDTRNPSRAKDISGLITLESGVQLWVVAEGTVLYIHHINVNENLFDELDTARIDTEPLPFHAKRLTACEDKISIMGRQDVLLLRFGKSGHIVDRATLPVGEDSLTNPLVKVPWCPGKTGIVALATLQHVKIYDITQDLEQYVEELVLPVGNVEDIQLFEDGGEVKVLILSSIGNIYQHKVISSVPQNNSFFLTNYFTVVDSRRDVGSAVTFHYSIATQLIFVSFDEASYVGAVAKERITSEDLSVKFKKLDVEATLSCWQEVNGMITALPVRRSSFIHYFYYKEDTLLVQSASQRKFAPYSHILLSGADNETVFGLSTYFDNTSIILSRVKWISLPDFWIEAVPLRLKTLAPVLSEDPTEDLPREHLPIMMEKCDVIEKVEITSPDLSKIYETKDLEARLKTVNNWPLTVHQTAKFTINFNVSDPNMVVRAFRLELPAEKAPAEVTFMGRTMKLDIPNNRFFDILLTRSETLSLDQCNLSLSFTGQGTAIMHGSAYCCITSIRVFGISRREFGYPKSSTVLKSPLSLPESTVYHLTKFFGKAAGFKLSNMNEEKMLLIARKLSSFRNSHLEVVTASNYLLRSMVGQDMKTYYLTKDKATLQDLSYWMLRGKPIPSNVLSEIVKQIKYMTYTRIGIFFKLVDEVLDGPLDLLQYLHSQLAATKEESPILLEVYVALTMIFLSTKESYSKSITQLFLSIFTDEKLSHFAHKVRLIAQTQISSFCMNARNDRTIARTLSTPLRVLRWGGLRPFYQKSKIIKPDESPFLTEDLMGETISTDDLNSTDMFELEAKFIIALLNEVLIKIRDDSHLCSLPKQGALVRNDAVPATSLLILAIVLMAQLYPTKLFPTVITLIDMVDWKSPSIDITESTYRQFILVRLISVLLTKCGDHIENRKKTTDKDEKKDKPSLDEVVAMSLSSPSTPCPELKSDLDDKIEQEERAASKRKSTEKLLEQITALLLEAGALDYCLEIVKALVPYWRLSSKEPKVVSKLWSRERSPFITDLANLSGSSTKHGSVDAFEHFYAMITDVALRLPYQMKKICKTINFKPEWIDALCEFLTIYQATQVRRQSKKLLIALCNGDKPYYRTVRDRHLMVNNMEKLRRKVNFSTADTLSHQQLTEVMEIVTLLKSAANERPLMWRDICQEKLMWLLELACRISGLVATQVVDLIVLAIRSSSDDTPNLADKIMDDKDTLCYVKMLMVRFLIGKDDGARWLLHGMMRSMIQLASRQHQVQIVRILYNELWPLANGLGSLGSQLSDLLSAYIPRFSSPSELLTVFNDEMLAISDLMKRIHREGHADAYNYTLQLGLGWKFMLMVHSPCLNCFSRKDGHELLKLNQIKTDARFSSNAMMLKLLGYHEISKVIVKLSDVKRNKIIKRVTLYYCPKMVESPIELKTNPRMWLKVGTAMGINGDGEIVITLALPVVASSLIIQFSEIAVAMQDNELHCPRCSNVVAANPGVCDNCGENAFQCVKCRAINYDERDPFLCQSCGYCKYARMDVSINCRSLPGVQTIASDAERSNAVEMMSKLLADIETSKTQLQYGRSMCEALATQVRPLPVTDFHLDSISKIDSFIHNAPQLAPTQHAFYGIVQVLNYCKNVHEELCTQTQQLIAYREEIRRYDYYISGTQKLLHQSMHPGFYNRSSKCFGCLCANILHSFAILQGVIEDSDCAKMVLEDYDTIEKLVLLGQAYEPLTRHCDEFVLKLSYESEVGAKRLCELTENGVLKPQILAKSILKYHDKYWQVKMKALVKMAVKSNSEDATLSLLMLIEKLLRDGKSLRKKMYTRRLDLLAKRKSNVHIASCSKNKTIVKNGCMDTYGKCDNWLNSNKDWREVDTKSTDIASDFLKEHENWFWKCVFCPKIAIRSASAKIMFSMCSQPGHLGVGVCMILRGLILARSVPSHMTDHFYRYAQKIVKQIQQVRIRLYKHGFHLALMDEIYKECKNLYEEEVEESSMDLDAGLLLRNNTELFANLLFGGPIEQSLLKSSRDHILRPLLQSTIFLKRIVFRRTRALDSSRLALEALLKRMSINEPVVLLRASVESLKSEKLDRYTQAQVVSLIMDVLDPEQEKEEDFSITIEKDSAQEDFLQGRMTGNPYKSSDAGLGPLMRDIKNKICRDTEMIALLEDDNGMELLVNNQIISLSLPVAAVYETLWRKTHPNQPMIIVYRMRGLLGDAVEPFVNSLQDDRAETSSDTSASNIVEAFIGCKGIEISNQLVHESEVSIGGRLLLTNLKRLFGCIARTGPGRIELVKSGSLAEFMRVVTMCVDGSCRDESILGIGLDYLKIMGSLTSDMKCHEYLGQLTASDSQWLVDMTMRRKVKRKQDFPEEWQPFQTCLIPLLGNLVLGSNESEDVLVEECRKSLNWVGIDEAQTAADIMTIRDVSIFDADVLAEVIDGILPSEFGKRMKSKILNSGVVAKACEHLLDTHPPLYSATESAEWKTFLAKPSLRLMLVVLASMAQRHDPTQLAISEKSLHILHRLEQVASDNSIGTLAENVIEALKGNKEVAEKIEAVREETKKKKRQMAMAMRHKQLNKMGMHVGKDGEVKVSARKIANEPVLDEVSDPLSACCICREPVLTGPKIAAAYAFAISHSLNELSSYSTVSQMVLVHIECHQGAIRRAGGPRNTDEWSKASLHNAGAKCNCLTPLATASATNMKEWEHSINRFHNDLEAVCSSPSLTRANVFTDICFLIDRFVQFSSFSDKSMGGGRESNSQYLAILHLLACTLPTVTDELPIAAPRWRMYSFLMTELSLESWNEQRSTVLRAALDDATTSMERNWSTLRELCLSWAFVDGYFKKVIPITDSDRLEWLRNHLQETFQKTVSFINWFDGTASRQEDPKSFTEVLDLDYEDFEPFFSDPLEES